MDFNEKRRRAYGAGEVTIVQYRKGTPSAPITVAAADAHKATTKRGYGRNLQRTTNHHFFEGEPK